MSALTTALKGYLTTAAATMSAPACKAVVPGQPDNVNLPTVAFWYIGTKTWAANTLNRTQELEGYAIQLYLPNGPQFVPASGSGEDWIVELTNAIRGQLYGHVAAAGQATGQGMELTDATAGYWQSGSGGVLCRVVTMDWWAMLTDVHVIAA